MIRILTLVLFVLGGAIVVAQGQQLPQGAEVFKKEWPLQELVPPKDTPPQAVEALEEKKCGPYLVSVPQSDGSLLGGIVLMKKGRVMFLDHQKIFKTTIDASKKSPMFEFQPTNIAVVDVFTADDTPVLSAAAGVRVNIRLSQADFDAAAKCLPPPEK